LRKEIFRLSWPNIITNVTVPLIGIVDLSVLGHVDKNPALYIGAISLGGIIFSFIYSGFSFLRMSTSGFTSQAYGKNNNQEIFYTFLRAIITALFIGGLLIIFKHKINNLSFYLLSGSSETEKISSQYFYIRILAAPATLSLSVIYGWFLGLQNAKIPMIISIVVNILNIIFDIIFVRFFNLYSDGVAYGTLIAQYSGLIVAIFFLLKQNILFNNIDIKILFKIQKIKKFLSVNRDIFIRTITLIFAISFFTNQSAKLGNNILTVNTILLQFLMFFSYITDGFAFAAEALAGKYYGKGDKKKLSLMINEILKITATISLIFTIIFIIFGKNILVIFTDNKNIITMCSNYIFWIYTIPVITFLSFIFDGIYIGTTQAKAMRNIMLISVFGVLVPEFYLLKNYMGNNGLWLSFMSFMLTRGALSYLFYKKTVIKDFVNNKIN